MARHTLVHQLAIFRLAGLAFGMVLGLAMPARAVVPAIPGLAPVASSASAMPYGSSDPGIADLAAVGYVQQEYFISGSIADGTPYTTRILVRRPADPKKFSGMVIAEAIRSTGSRSMWSLRRYITRSGHAYVEIGSNIVAINDLVKPSNGTRYAAVKVADPQPGELYSGYIHEIVAQTGMLLKANLPGGPFADFKLRHIILAGCSQQGVFVKLYRRDSHWLYRTKDDRPIFDGYFQACVADLPLTVKYDNGKSVGNFTIPPVDVPVVVYATQSEVETWPQDKRLYRRADSDAPNDRFRLYEVAGSPHGLNTRRTSGMVDCDGAKPPSGFHGEQLANSALDKLIKWVDGGVTPAAGRAPDHGRARRTFS